MLLFWQEDVNVLKPVDPKAKEVSYNPKYEQLFTAQVRLLLPEHSALGLCGGLWQICSYKHSGGMSATVELLYISIVISLIMNVVYFYWE